MLALAIASSSLVSAGQDGTIRVWNFNQQAGIFMSQVSLPVCHAAIQSTVSRPASRAHAAGQPQACTAQSLSQRATYEHVCVCVCICRQSLPRKTVGIRPVYTRCVSWATSCSLRTEGVPSWCVRRTHTHTHTRARRHPTYAVLVSKSKRSSIGQHAQTSVCVFTHEWDMYACVCCVHIGVGHVDRQARTEAPQRTRGPAHHAVARLRGKQQPAYMHAIALRNADHHNCLRAWRLCASSPYVCPCVCVCVCVRARLCVCVCTEHTDDSGYGRHSQGVAAARPPAPRTGPRHTARICLRQGKP